MKPDTPTAMKADRAAANKAEQHRARQAQFQIDFGVVAKYFGWSAEERVVVAAGCINSRGDVTPRALSCYRTVAHSLSIPDGPPMARGAGRAGR